MRLQLVDHPHVILQFLIIEVSEPEGYKSDRKERIFLFDFLFDLFRELDKLLGFFEVRMVFLFEGYF